MKTTRKPCVICRSADVLFERILSDISLVRCQKCSHVYADVASVDIVDLNITHYKKIYETTIEVPDINMNEFKMSWFTIIADMVTKLYGVGSVLDIGCGNGGLLLNFRERGWQVTGLDLSVEARQFAKKHGYRMISGLLEEADILPDTFDCVTATNVLEHIPEPILFVKKALNIIKPGGIIYLNVPNYKSLSIRLGVSKFFRNLPPHHCSYFTPESLLALFSQEGVIENVARVKVRSYGIPELHYTFSKAARQKGPKPPTGGAVGPVRNSVSKSEEKPDKMRLLAQRIAIASIFHAGRPFYWGDKLECVVVKK